MSDDFITWARETFPQIAKSENDAKMTGGLEAWRKFWFRNDPHGIDMLFIIMADGDGPIPDKTAFLDVFGKYFAWKQAQLNVPANRHERRQRKR